MVTFIDLNENVRPNMHLKAASHWIEIAIFSTNPVVTAQHGEVTKRDKIRPFVFFASKYLIQLFEKGTKTRE